MKIFKFDPATGKKGDLIGNFPRASWTSQSVDYQVKNNLIEPIEFKIPKSGQGSVWRAHVDAGVSHSKTGKPVSYLEENDWICFCLGQVFGGEWEWVVLPPRSAIVKKQLVSV